MNKAIITMLLSFITIPVTCDVIFFPNPFSGLCYSVELINSLEKIKNPKNTTNYWGGVGYAGSFQYTYMPFFGAEFVVEKRHYFQADKFRNLFISAYLGSAFVTNFADISTIGLVPGLKINYKAQVSPKFIIEPFLSFSLPIAYKFEWHSAEPLAFPSLAIGVRFGFSKLKNDNKPKS